MTRVKFISTILLAIALGLLGILLGGFIPLPSPFTTSQSRAFYALIGILTGLAYFAPISSWLINASTRLMKGLAVRIAKEVIEQFNQFNLFRPSPDKNKSPIDNVVKSCPIVLDTSSLIDGRVLDIAKNGFLSGTLVVADNVLRELQHVADSSDRLKRERGRRGFEIINQLKKIDGLKLVVWDKAIKGSEVDEKLINLAKNLKGKILTTDFNLNKVASLKGIKVLNINELANSLKSLPVPGEILEIKIIQKGKDKNQGVGYLEDGTMVIVKDGAEKIGNTVKIEVNKILQGPAGRIVFGEYK